MKNPPSREVAIEIVERHKLVIAKTFRPLLVTEIELKMYEYGLNEVDRVLQIMYADSIDKLRTTDYEEDEGYQKWKRKLTKRLK